MASSSSHLSKMQQAMDDILALHGKDLHAKIHVFPAKAQKAFFDQVTRRYVPQPNDVASYIEQGGEPMRNAYLNIVHELLYHNPYNGFCPHVQAVNTFQVKLSKTFHDLRQRRVLAYAHMDVVFAHLTKTLLCYPWMRSKQVTNLLNLAGEVCYLYNGNYYSAYVSIDLPASYPNDPPQVWVVCQDGWAINYGHMYVAPNGFVSIPYQGDWDGQSSSLLQLLLHMCVEFTSQPPTFIIDVGINLSYDQRELMKILLDYRFVHLYDEIKKITPQKTDAFFHEVTDRYRKEGIVDLPQHIRSSRGSLKKFINIVAEILGLPPKTRSTVDVANHHFLP